MDGKVDYVCPVILKSAGHEKDLYESQQIDDWRTTQTESAKRDGTSTGNHVQLFEVP